MSQFSRVVAMIGTVAITLSAQTDPGVRGGNAGAGDGLIGLSKPEYAAYEYGRGAFQEADSASESDGSGGGLGPRFNLDSCGGCHAHPAVGGTSPALNPQVALAKANGAINFLPSFIRADGPVREARFKYTDPPANTIRDGGVYGLFTITGRNDAPRCSIAQPDFNRAVAQGNISFRIPTPVFGGGLIEAIPDSAVLTNLAANRTAKQALGIRGHVNREGNAGTITRFGWKAQNKSLLIFAGEAYNVEQGVANELFPQKRDEISDCSYGPTPEDHTHFEEGAANGGIADVIAFANFMRLLAPPAAVGSYGTVTAASIANGKRLFASDSVGCALCHTPTLRTGASPIAALSHKDVELYSDLALHRMGFKLGDDMVQGLAGPEDFRTAPLWGVGQRIFFLHDGRTSDMVEAIQQHASPGSEANGSVAAFNALSAAEKQDVVNFLRSL